MIYPKIQANDGGRQMVDTFGGLNRAMKIREGEWQETMNLSSDHYPLLSTRRRRAKISAYDHVIDVIAKDVLWFLHEDDGSYMLNGVTLGSTADMNEPTGLVSMGAYIIVLGANVWYNTADGTHGSIDAEISIDASEDIRTAEEKAQQEGTTTDRPYGLKLCPCDEEGNVLIVSRMFSKAKAADVEDDDPQVEMESGKCYAIGSERTIRKYDATAPEKFRTMPNCLRIEAADITADAAQVGDVVSISGIPTTDRQAGVYNDGYAYDDVDPMMGTWNRNMDYNDDPNGYHEILKIGAGYMVLKDVFYTNLITANETGAPSAKAERKMPDMGFVVEAQNRLWGCKYGVVDGELVNEIYASALGDFKNWRKYDGTSMASWAASIGSDGKWTGAISYNGYPMFFKENKLHKVYISSYGAHQIRDYDITGVKEGCNKSLCVVDGVLYYVGKFGVYAYTGTAPERISDALGRETDHYHMFDAVADGADGKVYFGVYDGALNALYTYDARRGIWHEESVISEDGTVNMSVGSVTAYKNGIVMVLERAEGNEFLGLVGSESGQRESAVIWRCTSGLIGYTDAEQKYISRFDLRLYLAQGASMKVYIEYDSSGTFEQQAELSGTGTGSVVIPVRPRRCDHFRIRMSGVGQMALYSFQKIYKRGSDVV